ncbi:helicase-associated domain-containing protein [Oerskovia sp. M15]
MDHRQPRRARHPARCARAGPEPSLGPAPTVRPALRSRRPAWSGADVGRPPRGPALGFSARHAARPGDRRAAPRGGGPRGHGWVRSPRRVSRSCSPARRRGAHRGERAGERSRVGPAPEVDKLLLQGDLTGIVPGRPSGPLERLLEDAADVESRGAAITVRFTPESLTRAFDAGRTADDLLAELAAHSRAPLPSRSTTSSVTPPGATVDCAWAPHRATSAPRTPRC